MTTYLIVKTMQWLSYYELVDYLAESSTLLKALSKKVPSRSTLQNVSFSISEEFLTWMINSIGRFGMKR